MKTENMNSLEDLFTYGFSPAQAIEPNITGPAAIILPAGDKPLKTRPQATAPEVFQPAPAVSPEKSVTIL